VGSTVSIGRKALVRHPSVRARRRAVHESLLAAGTVTPEVVSNYELTNGTLAERKFLSLAIAANHNEIVADRWPCESAGLGTIPGTLFRDGESAVVCSPDGVLSLVSLNYGWLRVQVASDDRAAASAMCGAFRLQYPASYLHADEGNVPITFWTNGKHGPESRLRKIESAHWADIEGNYTSAVRTELGDLMSWNEPKRDGQLILWQGEPGTGKSWALRALASEWSSFAEFHYITDPDAFFVKDPSYMINVLLSDSYDAIDEKADVYSETDPMGKWRVLILEDTGELLAANAKESYGQGLSRLLNVVDGMIGQGLRVLALVTTNDELGTLHPAVSRPGRCASQLEFGPLSAEEASTFLGETVETGGTLAELYARKHEGQEALVEMSASGEVVPIPGAPGWGVRKEDLDRVLKMVDDAKAEDEETSNAGVTDELFAEVLALASEPIFVDDPPEPEAVQEPLPTVETLLASIDDLAVDPRFVDELKALTASSPLSMLLQAHRDTLVTAAELLAAQRGSEREERGDRIADKAVAALSGLVASGAVQDRTPTVHVHVPEHNVTVEPAQVTVNVPEQAAVPAPQIDVHVAAPQAPVVNFNVPEQAPPQVVVNVPETVVNVPPANVQVHTHAEQKPRAVRITFDPVTGEKIYVSEDLDD
jgi:hypothetical protein